MSEELTFEIGERYRNRLGWYEVLETLGNQIKVRYENTGKEDTLDVGIQKRIVLNIANEETQVDSIMTNREQFFFYLNQCNKYYRHDLDSYREVITMHRDEKDLNSLITKESGPVRPIPAYKAGHYGLTENRQLSNSNPKPAFIPVHRTGFSACFNKKFILLCEFSSLPETDQK